MASIQKRKNKNGIPIGAPLLQHYIHLDVQVTKKSSKKYL